MIAIADPIDADVLRARNEFLTLPGLHASADDVAVVLDVSLRHAAAILDSLVGEGFLDRTADGHYVRRPHGEAVVTRSIVCATVLVACVAATAATAATAAAQDAKATRGAQVSAAGFPESFPYY